jgi:APA family basic amino acid/polyamine antiporter
MPGVEAPTAPGTTGLERRLGLGSATAVVVGEVIGIGIFLTPAGMARSLGSPAWLLAVWLTMGLVTVAGALCFGALAARFPEAGGSYVYLREAFGPRPAFLYGWMSLLVTDPGLTALFATGMAGAFGDAVGLGPWGVKAVAVGSILAVAAVNAAGVTLGAVLLRGLAGLKLGLLGLIVVWGVGLGRGDWSNLLPLVAQRPGSDPLPKALAGAMVLAFFSFAGWWDLNKLAGEVRDPRRVLPRALVLGMAAVTAVYVVITLAFLYLVPTSRIGSGQGFAALAGEALFGRTGGVVFSSVVAVVVLGNLAAIVMAAPRVYYAMARDGLFPPALAALHPRTGAPARATAVQAVLASALVATGTFEQILAYFFFVTVAFLVLTVAGVYVLDRRPAGGEAGPVRVPGYPVTPLAFLVPTAALLVLLAADDPWHALLGLAVVLMGFAFYRVARR